jgi:hypothetical protein
MERAKLSVLQTSMYKSVTELTSQYNRLTTNGGAGAPRAARWPALTIKASTYQPKLVSRGIKSVYSI